MYQLNRSILNFLLPTSSLALLAVTIALLRYCMGRATCPNMWKSCVDSSFRRISIPVQYNSNIVIVVSAYTGGIVKCSQAFL